MPSVSENGKVLVDNLPLNVFTHPVHKPYFLCYSRLHVRSLRYLSISAAGPSLSNRFGGAQ